MQSDASNSEENLDTAVSYVRSVARAVAAKVATAAGYGFATIEAELAKYQRVNDEPYSAFALRYLSPDEIVSVWREAVKVAAAQMALARKRRR